jgi:DNA-binding transcriptional LysR family regulator
MNIPWEDLQLFLAVADEKSLSGAARALGLTQPTLSRRISALEKNIGSELFQRDAEGTRLTEAGARLWPAAHQMARFAKEIGQAADDLSAPASGDVIIGATAGATAGASHELLYPLMGAIKDSAVRLQVKSRMHPADLINGAAHLILTDAVPSETSLATLATFTLELGVFCSKAYARKVDKECGRTRHAVADLKWITAPTSGAPGPAEAALTDALLVAETQDFSPALSADDPQTRVRAAEAGVGALILPRACYLGNASPLVELDMTLSFAPVVVHLVGMDGAEHLSAVHYVTDALCDWARATDGVQLETS